MLQELKNMIAVSILEQVINDRKGLIRQQQDALEGMLLNKDALIKKLTDMNIPEDLILNTAKEIEANKKPEPTTQE